MKRLLSLLDCGDARVGDLGVVKAEVLQVGEFSETQQSGVGDR